jgi:hypothetical protein
LASCWSLAASANHCEDDMQPWLVFAVLISILCLVYPPLIGFCSGVFAFFAVSFVVFKVLGG